MTTPDNLLTFAFPDDILNGSITDAGGRIIYTLTSQKRSFGSDVTTIVKPDATVAAIIEWGSVIELKRRLVIVPNAIVPAKEYLAWDKANSLGGPGSQMFQDLGGNKFYWKNKQCWEGQTKALVAYYEPPDINRTMGPRLWVYPGYFSPIVVEPLIVTSLLMAKARHGATGGYRGPSGLGGGVGYVSGVYGGSDNYGGGYMCDGGGGGGCSGGGDSGGGGGGCGD